MTENADRSRWTLEEQAAHQLKLAEERKAWEEQKKREAEERERKEKQARLEVQLKRRAQAWADHTGSLPTPELLSRWQEEYVAERLLEEELALEERRQAAIEESYNFQPGKE